MPSSSFADPLSEVMQSPQYQDIKSKRRNQKDKLAYFEPGTNFSTIFLSHAGSKNLIIWSEPLDLEGYRGGQIEGRGGEGRELIIATRSYRKDDGARLKLQVAVPHPRYREIAENGFLSSLNDFLFVPPKQIVVTDLGEIHGVPHKLLLLVKPVCVVTGKLPLGAAVRFEIEPSVSASHCRKEFEKLNLVRLIGKLTS